MENSQKNLQPDENSDDSAGLCSGCNRKSIQLHFDHDTDLLENRFRKSGPLDHFSPVWSSLSWSEWVPFTADKNEFRKIPREPGLYRIRPAGKDFLMYIGQTGRPLNTRLNELRLPLKQTDLMPWNDPHTAAPSLWAWREAEGYEYECSAAPFDASTSGRQGMESLLLYRYRQQYGESTLCNFGRFHPRYRKSTDKKKNLRGGRLEAGQMDNPAGGLSSPPLHPAGKPGDPDWMGLSWSGCEILMPEKTQIAPPDPGLYLLSDPGSQEIVYIGQSGNCAKRLFDHCRKSWDGRKLEFSFHGVEKTVLPHQLKELENDLIGNFFEQSRRAPEFQFMNSR